MSAGQVVPVLCPVVLQYVASGGVVSVAVLVSGGAVPLPAT